MLTPFETNTYAKWILTGEHSVIRGGKALVFPLKHHILSLRFEPTDTPLTMSLNQNQSYEAILLDCLRYINHHYPIHLSGLTGHIFIESTIPIQSGLGGSAALSVALARLCKHWTPSISANGFTLARYIEHFFHGKSSGLDVAGAMSDQGVIFQQGELTPLHPVFHPIMVLTPTFDKGETKQCVEKVIAIQKTAPALFHLLDNQMNTSAEMAIQALTVQQINPHHPLMNAIKLAADCFKQWGLITHHMQVLTDELYQQGALAVKPTGSGYGGYLLSLFEHKPNKLPKGSLIITF
jgi:mevalonate kinase